MVSAIVLALLCEGIGSTEELIEDLKRVASIPVAANDVYNFNDKGAILPLGPGTPSLRPYSPYLSNQAFLSTKG